jgi:hypothetical protein
MHTSNETEIDLGGLKFGVSFREPAGATLRVNGEVDGQWTELLRFDDFVEAPHYHVPASGPQIEFDRDANGEPLAWYVAQVRDNLARLLTEGGYGEVVPKIDLTEISAHAGDIEKAMEECVPAGYIRTPGVGLQRQPA